MTDELLVKFLLKESTGEEKQEVLTWLDAAEENRRYFEQFRQIWDNSRQLAAVSTVNEEEAWQRMKERLVQESRLKKSRQEQAPGTWWRMAASVVGIICILGLAYIGYRKASTPETLQLAAAQQPLKAALPDGSTVVVNRRSNLSYPEQFRGNSRKVWLKGEAFFDIKPDKKKPFLINVNDLTVTVIGTSFNIRENADSTEIIVESGVVKVNFKGGNAELHSTEKLVVYQSGRQPRKQTTTDQLHAYFRTKTFSCDNTPLWKLVEVLNTAYDTNIRIDNPSIRTLPLTTTFNNESLENILTIISQTLDITVNRENGTIVLK